MRRILVVFMVFCLFFAIYISSSFTSEVSVNSRLPSGVGGKHGSYEEIRKSLDKLEYQIVRDSREPATMTLDELRKGCEAWRRKIKNLSVDFNFIQKPRPEALKPELKTASKLQYIEDSCRITFAIKNEKRYLSYQDLNPSKFPPEITEIQREPRLSAFNGQIMKEYLPQWNIGKIQNEKTAGFENHANFFFSTLNLSILQPELEKTPVCLMGAMALPNYFKVLPNLELVDGHPCHVISSGMDTFWLDHERGFAIRRRVFIRRTSEDDPGCLSYVMICKDFQKAVQGVWYPKKCIWLDYTDQSYPKTMRGRLRGIKNLTVNRFDINNVSDSIFEITFPPGSLVQDATIQKAYYMPKGLEMLDKAIAEGVPMTDFQVTAKPGSVTPAPTRTLRFVLILSTGLLICLISSILIFRRLKRS